MKYYKILKISIKQFKKKYKTKCEHNSACLANENKLRNI